MTPVVRRVAQLVALTGVQAVVLLGCAGTLRWRAAWLYLGLYVAMLVVGALTLMPRRSGVIEERSRGRAGAKPWDLVLTRLVSHTSISVLAVAGLAQRWEWQPVSGAGARALGVVLFVAGFALVLWAMSVNRFFSQVVRIQDERGHVAVTDGPYRWVRHPGYVGMMTSMAGAVLVLGSPWAWVPAVLYMVAMAVRTGLEDATLLEELPGYREYASGTRFRLVPGIW
jgi:protein-S-isoprenylcysteine O-methyltransferase Ste14